VRRILTPTLAVAILLGASVVCPAQDTAAGTAKPLLTVSFSGYDELLADIKFIGKVGDNPKLAEGIEALLKMATKDKGLAGLDTTKPWGVVIQAEGEKFPVLGFVPVTDLQKLLDLLEESDIKAEDAGDGVFQVETPAKTVFVKEKGGWALFADSSGGLADAPDDPVAMLGGLHEKYDLAVRVSIKNIPPQQRQRAITQLKAGINLASQQGPDETDEQYAIRTGIAKQMLDQLDAVLKELDELVVGLAIDRQSGTSYLDMQVTAIEGTKTAAQFANMRQTKTDYIGFNLPGAAVTGNWAGTLSDADVTQAKSSIATIRTAALKELKQQDLSDDDRQLAIGLLTDLLDVLEKTIESKKSDGGMVLKLAPQAVTFAVGGAIAEGDKLEKVIKQLAAVVKKDQPELVETLKLDAETHKGVRFHTLSLPVPEEEAVKFFGEKVSVVVGINQQSVYLAAGRNAAELLKQVIDRSADDPGKEIPPTRIAVAGTPIAKFVAAVADENVKPLATMVAGLLEQSEGKDHITITTKAIPNGAATRLEIEEGILKVLGQLGQMLSPGGPAQPGQPAAPFGEPAQPKEVF